LLVTVLLRSGSSNRSRILRTGFCLVLLAVVLASCRARGRYAALAPSRPHALQPSELTKVAVILVWARLVVIAPRQSQFATHAHSHSVQLHGAVSSWCSSSPTSAPAMVFVGILLAGPVLARLRGLHILFLLSPIVSSVLVIYGEDVTRNAWPFGIFIVTILIVAYWRRSFLVESISLVVANLGIGVALPYLWQHLKTYQQKRVTNFLAPDSDRLGAGWQVLQSKIAIGSGGFSGKGYLEGSQKALDYLPAKHTDFIFSVLGEELGFVGAMAILFVFGVLIVRALVAAQKMKSEFAATLCVGIASYFAFQLFVSMA
jgi:rod shape determining protein RodA